MELSPWGTAMSDPSGENAGDWWPLGTPMPLIAGVSPVSAAPSPALRSFTEGEALRSANTVPSTLNDIPRIMLRDGSVQGSPIVSPDGYLEIQYWLVAGLYKPICPR